MHGSFFSSVLSEKNHLTEDQMYDLIHLLEIKNPEAEYLNISLSYFRSGSSNRRKELKEQLAKIRKEVLKTENHLKVHVPDQAEDYFMEYYSDPYFKIIHVLLQIKEYRKKPVLMAAKLFLEKEKLEFYVKKLQDFGFIIHKTDGIEVLKQNYHLPKESPICLPHQVTLKNLSQSKLMTLSSDKHKSICVTFSGNKSTYSLIQSQFLKFLKDAEKEVIEAEEHNEVFQLNFDLFYWT